MAAYVYSFLVGEMVKRQMKVEDLACVLEISPRTLRNKLNNLTDFTWDEVCRIHTQFPEFSKEELFKKNSIDGVL